MIYTYRLISAHSIRYANMNTLTDRKILAVLILFILFVRGWGSGFGGVCVCGGGGVQDQLKEKKKLWQRNFFWSQLILQCVSNGYFKENYNFQGVQLLPRGSPPPPPRWIRAWIMSVRRGCDEQSSRWVNYLNRNAFFTWNWVYTTIILS